MNSLFRRKSAGRREHHREQRGDHDRPAVLDDEAHDRRVGSGQQAIDRVRDSRRAPCRG